MQDRPVGQEMVAQVLASIQEAQPDILLNAVRSALDLQLMGVDDFRDAALFPVVHKYLATEVGRHALLAAVRLLPQTSPQTAEIAALLSPAAPFLEESDERRIEALLRQCTVDDLPGLYHVATGGVARGYPQGLTSLWEVFAYLLDSNTRPGRLAPHLRLVAFAVRNLLHQRSPVLPDLVVELRRWMYQQCDRLRVSGDSGAAVELDRLLRHPPPFQTRDDFPISLIVEIDRLPAPNDQADLHQVNHWQQFDHTRWQPVPGDSREMPLAEVAGYVLELVREAEGGWGYGAKGPLLLEFILPEELINLAVDQWPQQAGNGVSPRALGLDYEIVLRSDARLRPRHKHRHWLARWERFMQGGGAAHLIPLEGPADLNRLQNELVNTQHLVACVLSTPPDMEPGRSELGLAVDAGLPIVLWCRNIERNSDFRTTLGDAIHSPNLKRLPTSIKQLRSSTSETCGNVALLWDDPNHVMPETQQLRTPSP